MWRKGTRTEKNAGERLQEPGGESRLMVSSGDESKAGEGTGKGGSGKFHRTLDEFGSMFPFVRALCALPHPPSRPPLRPRACLKIHSRHLHVPLRGIFGPNSDYIARYAPFIWAKSPTKWDAHLTESNFQTRSKTHRPSEKIAGSPRPAPTAFPQRFSPSADTSFH